MNEQTERTESPGEVTDEQKARRIARLEALRRWMLILAALLLIGGYAASFKPVLWGSVLPLSAALIITYRIKHLEEGTGK